MQEWLMDVKINVSVSRKKWTRRKTIWFQLSKRLLYTGSSLAHLTENIKLNQIDYILINKRNGNCIYSVKAYPSVDVKLYHNPVLVVFIVILKKVQSKQTKNKLNTIILQEKEIHENVEKENLNF